MDTGAIYSDFGHLASLKADAQKNPNAALEDVAEQFESLFLQMMMKSMRDATVKGDLFSSNQMDTYMSMADKQIAVSLSENGGIGIARMLVEQMQTQGLVSGSGNGKGPNDVTQLANSDQRSRLLHEMSEQALKESDKNVANTLKRNEEG